MKCPTASFLLAVLALASFPVPAAPRPPDSVRISGREYVRLADWARANAFQIRWLKRDETLQLTNSSSRILLAVDSRDAQINGIHAWLSFPIVARGGSAFLAQLDAQSLLRPILSPPQNRPGAKIKSVCLDPGHGGKDPGN